MRKWAAEVAGRAKFASTLPPDQAAANPSSLPVPCLVIHNKADLRGVTTLPWSFKTCYASLSGYLVQELPAHLLLTWRPGVVDIEDVHQKYESSVMRAANTWTGMAGRRGAWRRGPLAWLSSLLQQFKFRWASDHTARRCCSAIFGILLTCRACSCKKASIPQLMATLLACQVDSMIVWPVRACMAWHLRDASGVGLQEATGAVDAAFFIQRHAD